MSFDYPVRTAFHIYSNIFYIEVYTFSFSYKLPVRYTWNIIDFCKILHVFLLHDSFCLSTLAKITWVVLIQKTFVIRMFNCSNFGMSSISMRNCFFPTLGSVNYYFIDNRSQYVSTSCIWAEIHGKTQYFSCKFCKFTSDFRLQYDLGSMQKIEAPVSW